MVSSMCDLTQSSLRSQRVKTRIMVENKNGDTVNYDVVLEHIGQFGWSQMKIVFWLSFLSAAFGLSVVTFVFTGFSPHIRCHVPQCEDKNATYFASHPNGSVTIPSFYSNREIDIDDQCYIPDYKISEDGHCYDVKFTNKDELAKCPFDQLIIDRSVVSRSLVEDYGLLCERGYLRTILSSMFTFGMCIASSPLAPGRLARAATVILPRPGHPPNMVCKISLAL